MCGFLVAVYEMIVQSLTWPHCCVLSVQFPEYEDADVLTEGSTDDGEITITVTNPEKVGDGMGAYMMYTVTVKVSGPISFISAFKSLILLRI